MTRTLGAGPISLSPPPKGERMERKLRPALIILGLVNTAFLAGSGLLLGLCSNQVSIAANSLIFFFPSVFAKPWIRLLTDFIFAAGHMSWFVFANLFMENMWRSGSRVIVGTWSSVLTLLMFLMTAGLALRELHEVAVQIRRYARSPRVPSSLPPAGCVQCVHCRANEAILTARDADDEAGAQSPDLPPRSILHGIRAWAHGGYSPLPSYEDSTSSDGKIQLDANDDVLVQECEAPSAVPIPRPGRDEEEGF